MNTSVEKVSSAKYNNGFIVVSMSSGVEIRFPVAGNPRLVLGNEAQLNNIEISPYGLHWPELDEDLSFQGLITGDYGQSTRTEVSADIGGNLVLPHPGS